MLFISERGKAQADAAAAKKPKKNKKSSDEPISTTQSINNRPAAYVSSDGSEGASEPYYKEPSKANVVIPEETATGYATDYPNPFLDFGFTALFKAEEEHWDFERLYKYCKARKEFHTEDGEFDHKKFVELIQQTQVDVFWNTAEANRESVRNPLTDSNFDGIGATEFAERFGEFYKVFIGTVYLDYVSEQERLAKISQKLSEPREYNLISKKNPPADPAMGRVKNLTEAADDNAAKAVATIANGPVVPETPAPVVPSADATPTAPAESSAATEDSATDDQPITLTRGQLTNAVSLGVDAALAQLGISII